MHAPWSVVLTRCIHVELLLDRGEYGEKAGRVARCQALVGAVAIGYGVGFGRRTFGSPQIGWRVYPHALGTARHEVDRAVCLAAAAAPSGSNSTE